MTDFILSLIIAFLGMFFMLIRFEHTSPKG